MNQSANLLFTSESVTEGHPDKVADAISDSVLDAYIAQDPESLVACETFVTTGLVIVGGEISTRAEKTIDIQKIIRDRIREIGYVYAGQGFDADSCAVLNALHEQSRDIRQGVQKSESEIGAGDQGMMFGYACNETPEKMPLTMALSHRITQRLADLRKTGKIKWLRPDGKAQVTVEMTPDRKPVRVHTVVVSTQHDEAVGQEQIREEIKSQVIGAVIPKEFMTGQPILHINPTGRFVIGGPHGDSGLTGRKIIVDTYGGHAPHGGGAFSGKDPTKVDRSAAYMARYVAKNIVAAGLADRCQVQLAYAIGVADPVSVFVDCYGTSQADPSKLVSAVREIFPLKPAGIIKHLDLRRPIYSKTTAYGHFGRELKDFKWESLDKVEDLKRFFGSR